MFLNFMKQKCLFLLVILIQVKTFSTFTTDDKVSHFVYKRQAARTVGGSSFGFDDVAAGQPTTDDGMAELCENQRPKTPECRQFLRDRLIKCRKLENADLPECQGVDLKLDCTKRRWQSRKECQPETESSATPPQADDPSTGVAASGVNCDLNRNRNKPECKGRALNCKQRRNRNKPQCVKAGTQGRDDTAPAINCNAPRNKNKKQCRDAGATAPTINCNAPRNKNKKQCRDAGASGPKINCKADRNKNKKQCLDAGPQKLNCRRKINRQKPECAEEVALLKAKRAGNCKRARNKNKPKCVRKAAALAAQLAAAGTSGDPDVQLNCRGKNKKLPRCIKALEKHANCTGDLKYKQNCLGTGEAEQALQVLAWLTDITKDNDSIAIPGLPGTPGATSGKEDVESRFILAHGVPDIPFYRCITPRSQHGHCRYLQHCLLPAFTQDFNIFLSYVCFIQGVYVGACCPDSRYPEVTTTTTTTTPKPTTTTRPTTQPAQRGCGRNSLQKDLEQKSLQQTRIVGGKRAEYNEYPWAAALLRNGDSQYCGGVLISNRHVLTASHCVDGFKLEAVKVRLGEYTFDNDTESQHQDFTVKTIKMHEDYSRTTYVNDIAILTLSQPADIRDDAWPVCLPPPGETFVGDIGTVIGWGTIYYGGPVSSILQKVSLPVWTNEECAAAYPEQSIFEQNLCAGVDEGGKDSCQGDSGGPLLLLLPDVNRWVTIGVVSWGIKCAQPGNPGVYARVNKYLDWIDVNTN